MLAIDDRFSIDVLIAPLAGESVTGIDLRDDASPQSIYFRLRDARSRARAAERAAEYEPDNADGGGQPWSEVGRLASEALAQTSKDLEIASWLTESLVRSQGLRGLATGARVLSGLIEAFWDTGLHPQPDEDGIEARLAAVAGLSGSASDGTLMQPLRKLVLFERPGGTPLTLWQFEQAESVIALDDPAKQAKRRTADVPPLAEIEGEARAGGLPALTALGHDAEDALAAWQGLDHALEEVAGSDAPSTRRISELLRKILRISLRYAPRSEAPATVPDPAGDPVAAAVAESAAKPRPSPEFSDREALLQEVTRIAALFRLREPNSPFGYTLDNAVRRARLGWPELLREMLPEAAPRAAVLSQLGITPPSE